MMIEASSVITAANDDGRFFFVVEDSTTFAMRDSELHRCGWTVPYQLDWPKEEMGLKILTNNVVIENNAFVNNYCSVVLVEANNAQIIRNQFRDIIAEGVSMLLSHGNRIAENTFIGGYTGVSMHGACVGIVIANNTFTHHLESAIFGSGWNHEISGNSISSGGVGYASIWLGSSESRSGVGGNHKVLNNTILGGWHNGIILTRIFNNTIRGNTIHQAAKQGIEMFHAYGNLIAENEFLEIGLEGSLGVVLLWHSSENQILNNRIDQLSDGASGVMLLGGSKKNTLRSNIITSPSHGLSLHFSADSNAVIGNSISGEREQVIVVDSSFYNMIHQNNFFGGAQPPFDSGINYWDNGSAGNYWNDYNGTGVYYIAPNGVDHYPLAAPTAVIPVPVPELIPKPLVDPDHDPNLNVSSELTLENQTLTFDEISISSTGSLTLNNVNILISGGGINVESGGTLHVFNSTISATQTGMGYGFRAGPGTDLILKDSEVRGGSTDSGPDGGGIYTRADHATIENCRITDTFRGLMFESPTQGSYRLINNTITGCALGINFRNDQSSSLITGNRIEGCIDYAILLERSYSVVVSDNRISDLWSSGGGIACTDGADNKFVGNTITRMHAGHALSTRGDAILIVDNIITDSPSSAITVSGGQNFVIRSNMISNTDTGIGLLMEFKNSIVDSNQITNAKWGIVLDQNASNNSISNNILSGLGVNDDVGPSGLAVRGDGLNNIFTNNTIRNFEYGPRVSGLSSNNLFHHNNFANNLLESYDWGNNLWDNGSAGNYWSDYQGVDLNKDGIGDTPYDIQPKGVDRYPLMAPASGIVQFIPVTVTPVNLAPTGLAAGDSNVALVKMELELSPSDTGRIANWTGIQIDRTGSGSDEDVSAVEIWRDADANNIFDANTDIEIGSGTFSNRTTSITFSSFEQITNTSRDYFVVIDLSKTLSNPNGTFGIRLQYSNYFHLKYPAFVSPTNFPFESGKIVVKVSDFTLEVPKTFELEQNYPNPFNPETTIKYQLPKSTEVKLEIYNLLGQKVVTLVDKKQQAGYYSVKWNGAGDSGKNMSSGIYVYRLQSKEFVKERKLVLLR